MWEKMKKVLIGAGIAALGAFLSYLIAWVTSTDLGVYGPAIAAVLAVLVNLLRKLGEHLTDDMTRLEI